MSENLSVSERANGIEALRIWIGSAIESGTPPEPFLNLLFRFNDESRENMVELVTGSPEGADVLKLAGKTLNNLKSSD